PALSAVTPYSGMAQLLPFNPQEATEMIKKRLEGIPDPISDESAARLADRLGYFPLYMDQVLSFIESPPYALSLDQFYQQCPEVADLDDELQGLDPHGLWDSSGVAVAMEAHLNKILTPQHKVVLKTMAFFDPDDIPERLLFSSSLPSWALSTQLRQQKVLKHLSRYSFIVPSGRGDRAERSFSIHRLIRDAALRLDTSTQTTFDNAVGLLRHAFPLHGLARDHMVEDWVECEAFHLHVLALHQRYLEIRLKEAIVASYEFLELVYSCAWVPVQSSRDAKMSLFLADIYTVQLFYHNETTSEESLTNIALEAHRLREEAVRAGQMDPNHPNRANGFMNVGVALAHEDPLLALELHSKALEIRLGSDKYAAEQVHGVALNYLNMGRCCWILHDNAKAAECLGEALRLMKEREDETGKRFPLTAWALLTLAVVRAEQGDLYQAWELLSESMQLHRDTLGETHMKTLACYYRAAWVWHRMGQLQPAEYVQRVPLQRCAIRIRQSMLTRA
ncbi:hypothetical protein B0H67DRAFT_474708, partial [Lasiosphaeris hirsuta]